MNMPSMLCCCCCFLSLFSHELTQPYFLLLKFGYICYVWRPTRPKNSNKNCNPSRPVFSLDGMCEFRSKIASWENYLVLHDREMQKSFSRENGHDAANGEWRMENVEPCSTENYGESIESDNCISFYFCIFWMWLLSFLFMWDFWGPNRRTRGNGRIDRNDSMGMNCHFSHT